jgi:2-hydroxychromene-2-carboxylate isomerase
MNVVAYTIYHSVNSYLGMRMAERELAPLGVAVERRPIYVPRSRGLYVADLVGGRESPVHSSYHREDCARWAARYGVPLVLQPPEWFRQRAAIWQDAPFEREELPARAYYAALGSGKETALDRALFEAAFVERLDVNDESTIAHCAVRAGLDPPVLLRDARGDEPGRRVREALAAFDRDRCPGVPTFVFERQRFWGKDRVEFLAQTIRNARTG